MSWNISGNAVTQGLVTIKTQDKMGCVINATTVPADIVSFVLTANITNTFTPTLAITKNIDIFMEGVIMTRTTNPEVMAVCYAQGWAANENYMTEKEAIEVTDIGTSFRYKSSITSFDEFKYFTKISNIPSSLPLAITLDSST